MIPRAHIRDSCKVGQSYVSHTHPRCPPPHWRAITARYRDLVGEEQHPEHIAKRKTPDDLSIIQGFTFSAKASLC